MQERELELQLDEYEDEIQNCEQVIGTLQAELKEMGETNIFKTYTYLTDRDLVSFMDQNHQAMSFALL